MSDQGERGVRWTDMSESDEAGRPPAPDAGRSTGPQVVSSEPKVPEVFMPAPHGRTDFSDGGDEQAHDIWGKVEGRPGAGAPEGEAAQEREAASTQEPASAREAASTQEAAYEREAAYEQEGAAGQGPATWEEPAREERPGPWGRPEAEEQPAAWEEPAAEREPGALPDADDVRVAPVPAEGQEPPGWEGSLFEDGPGGAPADETPAVQVGLAGPAKAGKPSSGNWQMPDWMADEAAADAKLGGSPGSSGDAFDEGGGRSRLVLIGGVGLLVVALLAAGGVYYMTHRTDDASADTPVKTAPKGAAAEPDEPQVTVPADKALKRFPGKASKVLGRLTDAASGLSYPRLAPPWQLPTKKNKLSTPGWSGQQIVVTERHGQQLWYGQLLTGVLPPTLLGAYKGPGSVKKTTALAEQGYESQYYAFPHKSAPLASQPLNVDGHKGWLIASYLTYKRAGVRATGEIVATAVIDTGRKTPAAVFASLPNTHRKMWPDLNEFLAQLKVAA
ncbi:hypothetical protein [Actinomadura montaniterrae]|uniref:Uncharacterized protein n=1 Tax=Actinomadura montaniterrae TaxID=1803903 RepID=A0A6L3VSR2_9ACTN|nr:hypothetical protein [Actinomadura montaniterrae]KAB2380240.1 hypothetical protein F9B16_18035 [Actinomadura montaniterrae]